MAAKYELQDVLSLREMREDKRSKELQEARKALAEAEARLSAAQSELTAFQQQKPAEVDRLYAAVLKQIVQRLKLDDLKQALAALDARELTLAHAVEVAQQARDDAQQACDRAHDAYLAATRNVMKLDTHKESWKEEEAKEDERASDRELEEFTPLKRADDDDSSD